MGFIFFLGGSPAHGEQKGQPGLLELKQRKNGAEISQRPQEFSPAMEIPRPPKKPLEKSPPPPPKAPPLPKKESSRLQQAWRLYRQGDYNRAAALFFQETKSKKRSIALEARLGLSYSNLKRGEKEKSRALLEELVQEKYRLNETLPQLFSLLLEEKDYEKAQSYLSQWPKDQQAKWQNALAEGKIRRDFEKGMRSGDPRALRGFIETHRDGLRDCLAKEVFLKAGQALGKMGEKEWGAWVFQELLPCTEKDWELRLGIYFGLADLLPPQKALPMVQEEGKRGEGPSSYRSELQSLELSLWRKRLATVASSSFEVEEIAQGILAIAPADPAAQGALAWLYYHQKRDPEAEGLFAFLHQRYPEQQEYALGLIYTRLRLGRLSEVETLLEEKAFQGKEWDRLRGDVSWRRADEAFREKRFAEAEAYAKKVLDLDPDHLAAKSIKAWSIFEQGKDEEALRMAREEQNRPDRPAEFLEGMRALEHSVLGKRVAVLPPPSPEAEPVIQRMPEPAPEDPSAEKTLAWAYFHQEKYEEAYRLFSSLHERHPSEREFALGLIYTQLRLGKTREAQHTMERGDFQDGEWQTLKNHVYLKLAAEAYSENRFAEVEDYAKRALSIDPENRDGLSLLAWSRIQQGRYGEALPILLQESQRSPSARLSQDLLFLYKRAGQEDRAFQLAQTLVNDRDPAFRKIGADFYYAHDRPVTAAQAYSGRETCYYNADKTSMELGVDLRHKTGEEGLSRLLEISLPLTLDYPRRIGKNFTLALIPAHLNSGSAPALPYAGTYYRHLNGKGKTHNLETSLFLIRPEVGFQAEGPVRYGFLLGTTFWNAPVSPLPTVSAGLAGKNWQLRVDQGMVDESILSYAGLTDPYSGKAWGRVLKTGLEGEITFTPWPAYWFHLGAGYHYLWGEDVWSNQSLFGKVSVGRTFRIDPGDLSLGAFASLKHFQRNTDFFTYGHGGYFSPNLFFMIGPTLRFQTRPCLTYGVDARVSAGYLVYRTQDSPHYPLFDDRLASLNNAARNDATGRYRGDSQSKMGFDGKIRVKKLLAQRVIASAYGAINSTSGYNEWQFGIGLEYFFEPIFNVEEFKHFLRRDPPR